MEYVDYNNNVRTHLFFDGQPPNPTESPPSTTIADTKLIAKPIIGGLYHGYKKVA